MADSPESLPAPGSDSNPARTPAAKDKRCPFCKQFFTSSSLGRHLDLYIKEKNPKPADGVHNIDEIRTMRGSITRRSARTSSVKRESMTPAHTKPSPSASQRSASDGGLGAPGSSVPQAPVPTPTPTPTHALPSAPSPASAPARASTRGLAEASWQASNATRDFFSPATGAMASSRTDRHDGRRESVRKHKHGQEHERSRENGRAVDLALREVLDSLKIATTRARSRSPLPFDVFALTFPALVLYCLSAPPTLYSSHPFPTADSWSVDPPGEMQLHAVVEYLRAQYRQWQADVTRPVPRTSRMDSIAGVRAAETGVTGEGSRQSVMTPAAAQEQEERALNHASDAYAHWNVQSEQQKQDSWRLEILRAYSREKEERRRLDEQLELVQQELVHSKVLVDRMSRGAQPREFFLKPPAMLPLPHNVVKELSVASADHQEWEYEPLVAKWRLVAQQDRRASMSMAGQRPLGSMSLPNEGYHFPRADSTSHHHHQPLHQQAVPPPPPPPLPPPPPPPQQHAPQPPSLHLGAHQAQHGPHGSSSLTNGSTRSSFGASHLNNGPADMDDPMEDVSPGPGPAMDDSGPSGQSTPAGHRSGLSGRAPQPTTSRGSIGGGSSQASPLHPPAQMQHPPLHQGSQQPSLPPSLPPQSVATASTTAGAAATATAASQPRRQALPSAMQIDSDESRHARRTSVDSVSSAGSSASASGRRNMQHAGQTFHHGAPPLHAHQHPHANPHSGGHHHQHQQQQHHSHPQHHHHHHHRPHSNPHPHPHAPHHPSSHAHSSTAAPPPPPPPSTQRT